MNLDLLLHNGRIRTMDPARPLVSALAVRGDRILAVGDLDEVKAAVGPHAETRDLEGRTVLPGLIDTHNHQLATGIMLARVQLEHVRSLAELRAEIRRAAESRPAGEWIETSGRWHESTLAENRLPTRWELDAAAPDHPVVAQRGFHVAVLNSLALERAGLTRDTPDPPGGSLGRDPATGELTGLVQVLIAFPSLQAALPKLSLAAKRERLLGVQRAYNATGLTGARDPGLTSDDMRVYQDAWQRGELTVRSNVMPLLNANWSDEQLLSLIDGWGVTSGFGDEWLRLGALKVFTDGGVETGLFKQEYAHQRGYHGRQAWPQDKLERTLAAAARAGWQVGAHVVGDQAIDLALTAYEKADAETPLNGRRWTLEHGFHPNPGDFARAKRLGLIVTLQHPLVYSLAANMVAYWGPQRAAYTSPARAWLDSGVEVAGGTDSYVTPYDTLLALWGFVTRATELAGVQGPEQRIGRAEALRLYTTGAARVTFEENTKGALTPGKLADLVVLGDDPLTCPEPSLKTLPVVMTMVGGRIVYGEL